MTERQAQKKIKSNLMTGSGNLHKISGWTFIQIHPVKDGRERVELNGNYDR